MINKSAILSKLLWELETVEFKIEKNKIENKTYFKLQGKKYGLGELYKEVVAEKEIGNDFIHWLDWEIDLLTDKINYTYNKNKKLQLKGTERVYFNLYNEIVSGDYNET